MDGFIGFSATRLLKTAYLDTLEMNSENHQFVPFYLRILLSAKKSDQWMGVNL